jgi:DNA-binding transcriptional LysR family regulator
MADHVATFNAGFAALYTAHHVADHWMQTQHQALNKHLKNWTGRRACAGHVATYTVTAAAILLLVTNTLGITLVPARLASALAVSAAVHYWIDRRFTLERLATAVGKRDFYYLGAPRQGHDDNPSLGTGSYALDQSAHILTLLIAALILA